MKNFPMGEAWIGICSLDSGKSWLQWLTGEQVVYTNWREGEPGSYDGINYGAISWEDGKWMSRSSDDSVSGGGYICEWDIADYSDENVSDEQNELDDLEENETILNENRVVTGEEDRNYIISDSNTRYLERIDFENLSKEELRLARNEIYARKGRLFADEKLQAYFDAKDWYDGTVSPEDFDEETMLN